MRAEQQELRSLVKKILDPFKGTDTMVEGQHNVVACFLQDRKAEKAIEDFAKEHELFLRPFGGMHMIISPMPFHAVKAEKPKAKTIDAALREIEVFEPNQVICINPSIDRIDAAIHALMDVEKCVPEAIRMESATQHCITRLQNLREEIIRKTYQL